MKRFVTFSSQGVPRGDVRGGSDPSRSSSSSPAGAQSQCGALRGAGAPPSPPRPPPPHPGRLAEGVGSIAPSQSCLLAPMPSASH